jgi:hypothetical protein
VTLEGSGEYVWPLAISFAWADGSHQFLCMNVSDDRFTERDGRKGPPAGNKARCNRTNTPHSKSMQRKAKPNQTPQTHTRGARQAVSDDRWSIFLG